eukprot:TRINITY_DN90588_c0_g1_i1.p1 TRINITY_DN90588_c0_g1~~TRINITY_DN90588_c0_g1_i1.p1  ORF type:complete len:1550 (+),score=367.17 TRINITY_DN90588_c0_g1_i1:669-4652(+)
MTCMRNLCPLAVEKLRPDTCGQKKPGFLRVRAVTCTEEDEGTILAVISGRVLGEVMADVTAYRRNRDRLVSLFNVIMSNFVFPAAPPEVVWAMAKIAVRYRVPEGSLVCLEDEHETVGDLHIVEEGTGVVEKLVAVVGGGIPMKAGEVGPGAIIGSTVHLAINIPRAASLKALTSMFVVKLPVSEVLSVLWRFPGTVACMKTGLRQLLKDLQKGLPGRAEILHVPPIFSKCKEEFVSKLAAVTQRLFFHLGDIVREQGSGDNTMYVVEYGLCAISQEDGRPGDHLSMGDAIGAEVLLGQETTWTKGTVRAATPITTLLTLSQMAFSIVLQKLPKEMRRLEELRIEDGAKGGMRCCSDLAAYDIFRNCGQSFIYRMQEIRTWLCYMPGQTVCVQAVADSGSMYVVKGGELVVEVDGDLVKKLHPGDGFGELAMLGITRRRNATVRAVTMCFINEIPRAPFHDSLEAHREEADLFAQMTAEYGKTFVGVQWPIFRGISSGGRLEYMVNFHSERRVTAADAWVNKNGKSMGPPVAFLVMQGKIKWTYTDVHGNVGTMDLVEGKCFNEQMLLGLSETPGTLLPIGGCEIQVLSKEVFDKIIIELPALSDTILHSVKIEIASKAEHQLGLQPKTSAPLRFSALFRVTPKAFCEHVFSKVDTRLFLPGSCLCNIGEEGENMIILLHSTAYIDNGKASDSRTRLPAGTVLGEALALRVLTRFPSTVRAAEACVTRLVAVHDFQDALAQFPEAQQCFEQVTKENEEVSVMESLQKHPVMSKGGQGFLDIVVRNYDDLFFAPGDLIIAGADQSFLGETPMHVMLSGSADVENEYDVICTSLYAGDVFGEDGALGIAKDHLRALRCWEGGLTRVARLQGVSMKAAVDAYPREIMNIVDAADRLQNTKDSGNIEWKRFLANDVVPNLARNVIFASFPRPLITKVVTPLVKACYAEGDVITKLGDEDESMIYLAKGEARIFSKANKAVGMYTEGAIFGETAVLGLYKQRTATVVAATDCEVLSIPAALIHHVLAPRAEMASRKAFARIVDDRQLQVAQAMPINALHSLGVHKEDVAARLIALHAERFDWPQGHLFKPLADDGPCGPCFTVLVRGFAELVVGKDKTPVNGLPAPAILLEGLYAEHGGMVFCQTPCEAYRVRMCDFLLTAEAAPSCKAWLPHFRRHYRLAKEFIEGRLANASGAVMCRRYKQTDDELEKWKRLQAETAQEWQSSHDADRTPADKWRLVTKEKKMDALGLKGSSSTSLLPPVEAPPKQYNAAHAWVAYAKGRGGPLQKTSSLPMLSREFAVNSPTGAGTVKRTRNSPTARAAPARSAQAVAA